MVTNGFHAVSKVYVLYYLYHVQKLIPPLPPSKLLTLYTSFLKDKGSSCCSCFCKRKKVIDNKEGEQGGSCESSTFVMY